MADIAETTPSIDETAPAAAAVLAEAEAEGSQVDTPKTSPEEELKSKKVTLADLTAKATALYSKKEYESAAEFFSMAAEMQVELNGEDHPDNAEILFLYGRSLFKVGQSRSDVLGGQAAADMAKPQAAEPKAPKTKSSTAPAGETEDNKSDAQKVTQEGLAIVAEDKEGTKKEEAEPKKALFQFEGDEEFEESGDEEEAHGDEEEGDEDDEDDLSRAFYTLGVARFTLQKRLEQLEAEDSTSEDKGKEVAEGDNPNIRHVKERLADTHDLMAEISLEGENFTAALHDSRLALKYKKELFPPESEVIAEAHFKLSLALEFASVTTTKEEGDESADAAPFDQELRDEAVAELEAAIASTKLKLQNKEIELAEGANPEENVATKAQITDVREIVADMEQRLEDLRKPPVDLKATLEDAAGSAIQGILGSALGESAAQTEARVQEAKKTATDLTSLVKKKKKDDDKPAQEESAGNDTNGTKRKAEDAVPEEEPAKKAKVEGGETTEETAA